eukprot:CAMPEP_0170197388 /NCGR_PEP_ID=MMETSP0040_2-20121228/66279_1 /TAXON_ID=641309 /ORGANISM="Lotharella oceanica, Strain CCMP622" /LENGTH=86 /DNA_ID=CAMNT_0010447045 /DNA_START=236 /DNA_END=493 /DNA_ORIENTATION=+
MEAERARDEKMRFTEMGLPQRYYHQFGELQWEYNKQLITEANGGKEPEDFNLARKYEIYKDAGMSRRKDASSYRLRNYFLHPDGGW